MPHDVRGLTPLLSVYDMPNSVHFYRDLLGFEVAMSSPPVEEVMFHWCLLRLGRAELMLNTEYEFNSERPAERPPAFTQAHSMVCLYIGCPDVDAAYEELKDKIPGLKKPTVSTYGMKQMYLSDPDGYGLCFQWQAS
jgi:catechol 2,3-dioxygenase-like lactoylglutathione lyase family enzyme